MELSLVAQHVSLYEENAEEVRNSDKYGLLKL